MSTDNFQNILFERHSGLRDGSGEKKRFLGVGKLHYVNRMGQTLDHQGVHTAKKEHCF